MIGNESQRSLFQYGGLNEYFDNYYMTDAISRNSAVMARCTKQ